MELGPAQVLGSLGTPPDPVLLGPHGTELAAVLDRPFRVLHRALELYTAGTALSLLMDLGWEDRLRTGTTLDGLCRGLPDQARTPLAWMLPFLAQESLLDLLGGRYFLEGSPRLDLAGIRAMAEAEAPGHGANFDLLDGVRTHIPPFFTEGKPGDGLLFDLALFPLWLAYFRNDNPVYYPNNLLALLGLREGLAEGSRVLELGGGAGSFARLVAQRGAAEGWLGRISEYVFTDVAPAFLRRAQRELGAAAPGLPLRFRPLDLNRPLGDQGIEAAGLDVIVAINVVHVARNLEASLRDLRSRLKPGGRLVLGECMKPSLGHPIYLEFVFSFLRSFTDVELDPRWRPVHGFLTPEAWMAALDHAGFRDLACIPPPRPLMDRHPSFNVGALVGVA
ncbi:MAG TPA: class I SAM-dependent methyltransferase [Holophagaceae bacterium]